MSPPLLMIDIKGCCMTFAQSRPITGGGRRERALDERTHAGDERQWTDQALKQRRDDA